MRTAAVILTLGLGLGSVGVATAASAAPAVWTQQPSLTAPDAAVGDNFGAGVTISISGTTAFVSAYQKAIDGKNAAGAVDVYVRSGSTWTFQAELTANDGAEGDQFGASISTTKDGSTVVIGAPLKTVADKPDAGAAYVFVRTGTTWKQRTELTGTPSGRGNEFGSDVAINGVAGYIAVAAPLRSAGGQRRAGAVYIFKRDHLVYPQYQLLTEPTPGLNHYFGWALVVKEAQVIVSSPFHANDDGSTGVVYGFENPTGPYVLKSTLTASDGQPNDDFGWAMSESVATMVITARNHVSAHGRGAVYVFTHSDRTDVWTARPPILPPDGSSTDDFGESVSISNGTVVIGDPYHQVGDNMDQGVAYVYTGATSHWTKRAELTPSDAGAFTEFGEFVAAYTDTVMVGEPEQTVDGLTGAGLVDVFALS
jgi:FG-GAP repeat